MTGLEQIIWYTIPGVILTVPLAIIYFPSTVHDKIPGGLWPFLVLAVGYSFHQIHRACWEGCYSGFWTSERESLDWLIAKFNGGDKDHRLDSQKMCDRKKAFLTWEHVFYHKLSSKEFIDHDRGAWHYILSFRTVSWVCYVSLALIIFPETIYKNPCFCLSLTSFKNQILYLIAPLIVWPVMAGSLLCLEESLCGSDRRALWALYTLVHTLALIVLCGLAVTFGIEIYILLLAGLLIVVGGFLRWKASLTLESIVEQEKVMIDEEWSNFHCTLANIVAEYRDS